MSRAGHHILVLSAVYISGMYIWQADILSPKPLDPGERLFTQKCSRTYVSLLVSRSYNKLDRFASRYRDSLLEEMNALVTPYDQYTLIHASHPSLSALQD